MEKTHHNGRKGRLLAVVGYGGDWGWFWWRLRIVLMVVAAMVLHQAAVLRWSLVVATWSGGRRQLLGGCMLVDG